MNFLEKLDHLMSIRCDTVASLSRGSGIPYTTIDGLYKKGYSNVKLGTLLKLCDYFHVSLDYLVLEDALDEPALSDDERWLLSLYRGADESARQIALETLQHHQKKSSSSTGAAS